ncbi:hypothetical protein PPYR_03524 [Photinus pyralis]|uniref:Uncharacterized protein n=1 Tax=Photinus pyralis TaxID=7054 RepID=A0A1Y1LG50_PHOPY|nr:zinc finger and BTB domain-containing protein 6-like [Photinus pyralis]KAB0791724.1 hypothetical protein PPYR_03524 [Photinus pyralis]
MSGTRTCRTCLQSFDVSETHSDNLTNLKEKIESCIPFVTLDLVKDYILCRACIEALSNAYQYKQMCQETEEKIYNYLLNSSCKDTKSIDIDNVVQWLRAPAVVDHIDLVDSETESAIDSDDDLLEIHKHELTDDEDFKVIFNGEDEEEDPNYQRLCEIEKQFASYSIDEFYSKGLVKLPECRVALNPLSQDLIQRYSAKPSAAGSPKRQVKKRRRRKRNQIESKPAANDLKETRSYSCPWCKYSSMYEKRLFRHLQEHNSIYREFDHNRSLLRCLLCEYVTYFQMQLESHYLGHFITPPFECKLCNAKFKFRTRLITHILGHSQRCGVIESEHNYALV